MDHTIDLTTKEQLKNLTHMLCFQIHVTNCIKKACYLIFSH
jgi:hypothetical protein